MCEDPLMAAIHFERKFDALMTYVINSQEHPIGKVKDFFYRVEFKIRGSCHYLVTTFFFCIEKIPQDISCDTRDVLVQYIDSVIKTDIPDESDVELCQLVKWLQTHSHSKYFQKTPPLCGRFKFPFVLQTIEFIIKWTMPLRNNMIAHKENKYFHPQKHIAHSMKISRGF